MALFFGNKKYMLRVSSIVSFRMCLEARTVCCRNLVTQEKNAFANEGQSETTLTRLTRCSLLAKKLHEVGRNSTIFTIKN